MATALKTRNFGGYTKASLGKAALLVNVKKLAKLIEGSPTGKNEHPTGLPSPEFDRIDPVTRGVLIEELANLFDASNNANFGTTPASTLTS